MQWLFTYFFAVYNWLSSLDFTRPMFLLRCQILLTLKTCKCIVFPVLKRLCFTITLSDFTFSSHPGWCWPKFRLDWSGSGSAWLPWSPQAGGSLPPANPVTHIVWVEGPLRLSLRGINPLKTSLHTPWRHYGLFRMEKSEFRRCMAVFVNAHIAHAHAHYVGDLFDSVEGRAF